MHDPYDKPLIDVHIWELGPLVADNRVGVVGLKVF